MGWASGSTVMQEIIQEVRKKFKDPKVRQRIYECVIPALESADWDTQDECLDDPEFEAAFNKLH
jgi:hypothetical protein